LVLKRGGGTIAGARLIDAPPSFRHTLPSRGLFTLMSVLLFLFALRSLPFKNSSLCSKGFLPFPPYPSPMPFSLILFYFWSRLVPPPLHAHGEFRTPRRNSLFFFSAYPPNHLPFPDFIPCLGREFLMFTMTFFSEGVGATLLSCAWSILVPLTFKPSTPVPFPFTVLPFS